MSMCLARTHKTVLGRRKIEINVMENSMKFLTYEGC